MNERLELFAEQKRPQLEAMGWYVAYDDSTGLSLHRRFKNGKPLKGDDVRLTYTRYTTRAEFDPETGGTKDVITGERERPWTVRIDEETTRTFKRFHDALEAFLEGAEELAPVD